MSPRTVTMAEPSVGVVADCNSGAMVASLPAERHSRPARRNALCDLWASGPAVPLWGGERPHVDSLGALLALGDVELDGFALVQRATVLDGADVDEQVVAGLGLDEAVALVGVEPLDGSNRHAACPPSVSSEVSVHTGTRRPGAWDKLDCAAAKRDLCWAERS